MLDAIGQSAQAAPRARGRDLPGPALRRGPRAAGGLDHGLRGRGEVGLPGAEQPEQHRRRQGRSVRADGVGDGSCRRLGHHHDQLGGGVGVEQVEGAQRGQSAHGLGQVTPADAETVRDADPGAVEQRHQVLRARAGGGDDPDRTGTDHVGEAEPDPADDGGAAVGPHHQDTGLGGTLLEQHLLLQGHVVAEDHGEQAGVDRVEGVGEGEAARRGDQRDGRGRVDGLRGGGDRGRRRRRPEPAAGRP
jgi:hypothetical protein